MTAINDGGPAFPAPDAGEEHFSQRSAYMGMSLRDYFAAKAMQSQVATDMVPGEACDALLDAAELDDQDPLYRLALNSYEIADAMLRAREVKS